LLNNRDVTGEALVILEMGQASLAVLFICSLLPVVAQVKGQTLSELEKTLIDAAREGDLEVVERLIHDGARVNVIDDTGTTPLHWAVFGGHQDVTKALIAQGALVNVPDVDGFTPLDTASQKGFTKLVQLLIKEGANLEARDNDGGTALYAAAGKGHVRVVEVLLSAGADAESRFTKTDDTALLFAASEGHDEVVSVLAKASADVEARNRAGFFPLYQAALRGHDAVIRVLLEADASPDDSLEKDGETSLMAAAFGGHVGAVQALVDGEADVNAQNSRRKTALHQAPLLFDRIGVAKALVEAGAFVNLEDNKANTPLHIASQFGAKNIVSYLLTVGADPEAVNRESLTPREIICDCLEFAEFPSSLQCPKGKCDSRNDISSIRSIIDGERSDADTTTAGDQDDDDGPGVLPPTASDRPLFDPAADETEGDTANAVTRGSTQTTPAAVPDAGDEFVVLEGGLGATQGGT